MILTALKMMMKILTWMRQNRVPSILLKVRAEEKDHDLEDVVNDKSKSSYMKNLENYADTAKKEKLDEVKPDAKDHAGEPEKLEQEEIVDEVGMAIDSALNDL